MLLSPQLALADIGVYLGINLTFYGNVGITVKALSSDKNENHVFALGSTYYPFSANKFGYDIGFGRNVYGAAILWGIDIPNDTAYFSAGYLPD